MLSPIDVDLERIDPLTVIGLERKQQRRMCDDLERLADQLGGVLDVGLCTTLHRQLLTDLPVFLRDEEALFDLLQRNGRGDDLLSAFTSQAKTQHATMHAYVFELFEPLSEIGQGIAPRNLDAVGYMFRYCFDIMRQHMQWEDIAILRQQALDELMPDLEHLRQAMQRNRYDLT